MKKNLIVTVIKKFKISMYGSGIYLYNPDQLSNSLTEFDKGILFDYIKDNRERLDNTLDWLVGNPPEKFFTDYTVRASFDPNAFSLHKWPSHSTMVSKVSGIERICNDSQVKSELICYPQAEKGDSLGQGNSQHVIEFTRLVTYEDFMGIIEAAFKTRGKFTLPFNTRDEQLRDYISFYISIKKFKNERI